MVSSVSVIVLHRVALFCAVLCSRFIKLDSFERKNLNFEVNAMS